MCSKGKWKENGRKEGEGEKKTSIEALHAHDSNENIMQLIWPTGLHFSDISVYVMEFSATYLNPKINKNNCKFQLSQVMEKK